MPSLGSFDPNQHQDSFEPLPAGDYLVTIVESDIDTTEKGQQVKVTMEVQQPEQHYGRKCFANFTLEHQNPKAVEVGRRILANLCRAVGVMSPRETEELHDIPFNVRLVVDQWDDGSLHNEAKAYWSTQSAPPPQPKSKPKAPVAPVAPTQPYGAPGMGRTHYQPPAPPRPAAAPAPGQWQPPAASYPGQGGQPAQTWQPAPQQPPQGHQPQQAYYPPQGQPQAPQAPQQAFTNPVYPVGHPTNQSQPMQPQGHQQAYQPPQPPQAAAPVGQPPWAQQPQPGQGVPPSDDVPF